MAIGTRTEARTNGPVAAICRDRRQATRAAAALRRARVDPRRIAIVANELPDSDSASWVTVGCLNAIGAGLEGLGLPKAELGRCRRALREDGILVVVQGAPEERP